MRIAGIDSGKQRDSFAFVGIEIKNDCIYVKGVKTWLGRKYIEVENLIAKIHDKSPFDYYVVEINNTGEHVFEELKYRHKIPNVIPTFTSANVKDQFPKTSNKDIEELKRQIAIFSEHITEAGNVSYRAEGQEHDDTVMALMLAVFIGRNYIKNIDGFFQKVGVTSKKFDMNNDDLLGSGVPHGLEALSRDVFTP